MPHLLEREQDASSEAGDDAAAAAELDARGFENGLVPRPEEERVAYNRKDQMRNKLQVRAHISMGSTTGGGCHAPPPNEMGANNAFGPQFLGE